MDVLSGWRCENHISFLGRIDMSGNVWNFPLLSYMVDMGILSNNIRPPRPSPEFYMTWSMTICSDALSSLSRDFCYRTGPFYRFWPYYLIPRGFHETFATDAACQQRTLTPPDTLSCFIACVFKCWDWSLLNLSLFRILNFEHPSVLLFCLVRTGFTTYVLQQNLLTIGERNPHCWKNRRGF